MSCVLGRMFCPHSLQRCLRISPNPILIIPPPSPCLKSLVLAPAARNNRTGKGREKGSPSAAKHINLQIYLVGIIPEGETDPILHHPTNCPHLFGDSNRRLGTCARSSSEATCPCFPGSHTPLPSPRDVSGCFSSLWKFPQLLPGWGSIPGQPEEFISESVVGYTGNFSKKSNVQLTVTWNSLP